LAVVLIVVSHIVSIGRASDTNSWLEKTSKVHFILQQLTKVVSAFHSGVFSCLLVWVVTIIRWGLGDTSGCKRRNNSNRIALRNTCRVSTS